jgi:hypothetical protein
LRPDVAGWERPKVDPDGGVIAHRSALRLHGLGDLVNDRHRRNWHVCLLPIP